MGVLVPLRLAVKTVGDPPKSPSALCWAAGTSQESWSDRSVPDSRTIDSACAGCILAALPVVAKTELSPSVDSATLLHTLAPLWPGIAGQVACWTPVSWLNSTTPAGTSGLSHWEEMPT